MASRSLPGDLAGRGEPGVEESGDDETWKPKVYEGQEICHNAKLPRSSRLKNERCRLRT